MFKLRETLTRMLSVAAVAGAGLVASTALVDPAAVAAPPKNGIGIDPVGICNLFTGVGTVRWVISNNLTTDVNAPITVTVSPPFKGSFSPTSGLIPHLEQFTFEQTIAAAEVAGQDSILFHVTLSDGKEDNLQGAFSFPSPCTPIPSPISIDGVASCDATGNGATVTWTVRNHGSADATVQKVDRAPSGAAVVLKEDTSVDVLSTGFNVRSGNTVHLVEKIASTDGRANLTLLLALSLDIMNSESLRSNDVDVNCDRASASPSEVTSTGSPAGSAAPGLPLTGTSITGLVVAGVVFLAVGGGLVVMARRRRIRLDV